MKRALNDRAEDYAKLAGIARDESRDYFLKQREMYLETVAQLDEIIHKVVYTQGLKTRIYVKL